jgi:hypothetical protein
MYIRVRRTCLGTGNALLRIAAFSAFISQWDSERCLTIDVRSCFLIRREMVAVGLPRIKWDLQRVTPHIMTFSILRALVFSTLLSSVLAAEAKTE